MTRFEFISIIIALATVGFSIVTAIIGVTYHLGGKITGISQSIESVKEIITRDRHDARDRLNEHQVSNERDKAIIHNRIDGLNERVRPLESSMEALEKVCAERHKEKVND